MTLRELLVNPAIKGICIGWCPDGSDFKGIHAHAHHHASHGKQRGLICIATPSQYTLTTIRHELAHLLRSNARHDEAFWDEVRAMGGRKERGYS